MIKSIIKIIFAKIFEKSKDCYQLEIYRNYRKNYSIDESFNFNGEGTLLYGDGKIVLEENSYIGRFSLIQSSGEEIVSIGKNCSIGPFLKIWTHSSQVDSDFNFKDQRIPRIGSVFIKDAVWIGANVLIAPGITIGSNSIIGTNSVVTKNVPDFAIVGGVPAKLIRYKNIIK